MDAFPVETYLLLVMGFECWESAGPQSTPLDILEHSSTCNALKLHHMPPKPEVDFTSRPSSPSRRVAGLVREH